MLKLLYTSTLIPNPPPFSLFVRAFWINSVDAIFFYALDGVNAMFKTYLDGTTITLGGFTFNGDNLDFDNAPEYGDLLIRSTSRGMSAPLDPISFLIDIQKPVTSGMANADLTGGMYLRDRAGVLKYYKDFSRGYKLFDAVSGVEEKTVEVYGSGNAINRNITWFEDQTICCANSDGDVFLFDVDTETLLLTSFIDPPRHVMVDNTHGNIISIRDSDGVVQVWKPEVEPVTMSSLSATPGTYTRYHTEEISVTVLGDTGEPAAGVPVEWTVEILGGFGGAVNVEEVNKEEVNMGAASSAAKGRITPNVSITDALGVATATYCPPGLDWVSMDQETITALVRT